MVLEYKLSLDYDGISPHYLEVELKRLEKKFPGLGKEVYISSTDSYHIRFLELMTWHKAIRIMNYSNCSEKYKDFCKRVKMFPIRVGRKLRFYSGNLEVKPTPIRCTNIKHLCRS